MARRQRGARAGDAIRVSERSESEPTSAAANRPVVVFWYGGAWVYGAKEEFRFVAAALAEAGYVAVLPDYRLYPEARFPTFVEDGALALRWAHEHGPLAIAHADSSAHCRIHRRPLALEPI